ncbi:SUMF1/EgtB/PvdO family nonheme iron enzyme [bacterium]|nr:SUMF1/EgtB/PvdO family nonheme iron enzyme [bacterium]
MRMAYSLVLALLLAGSAWAQAPEDLRPLAARTFTRSFGDGNVSLEYTLRAGPMMEPGKRRFIEIDIDTLLRADAEQRGEFAIPLNGFIAIALPRGIEPDGELRMKWYNDRTSRYDFMYSAPYPDSALLGGMSQAALDATSNEATRILSGMRGLSEGLDGGISFSGPEDPRLLGSDPNYAITGTSWLIPCTSLFQQLVDPFTPERSMQFNPRLKASLPVRITESVANPRILVYVGSLSTALGQTTVMSDAIPANVRLLDEAPPQQAEPVAEGDAAAVTLEGDALPEAPPAVALRAIAYSYGWAAWESEVDLSAMIVPSALVEGYQPMETEMPDGPVNLDPMPGTGSSGGISIGAADQSERREIGAGDSGTTDAAAQEGTPISLEEAEESSEAITSGNTVDDAELEAEAATEDGGQSSGGGDSESEESPAERTNPDSDVHGNPENQTQDAADSDSTEEEVAPGSLAELKERVEERRDRESGNSVEIELPTGGRESTPAAEAQQAAENVNAAQDAEVRNGQPDDEAVQPEDGTELPERDDIPAFAFPEETGAERDITESAVDTTTVNGEQDQVREVEPGTLPGPESQFSVPLKQITGRDGRKPGGNSAGGSAPDYTQLYIGGGPGGSTAAGTTPGDLGDMVFIPGGKFLMGTDELASAGDEDERPLHEVEVADFYIDKYPVTNRQFYQFVLSDGYKPQGNWQKYFEPGTADMPVRGVTWEDADAYCRWAGKRLPTEAEWEKAARGEDGRLYPWGNDWSSDILPRGSLNYRLVLNQKAASPYGVLALVGVLWQWTASSHAPYPFDPAAGGELKVLRGGAFSNGRNIIRCANRYPEDPSVSFNTFTFRCARDAN